MRMTRGTRMTCDEPTGREKERQQKQARLSNINQKSKACVAYLLFMLQEPRTHCLVLCVCLLSSPVFVLSPVGSKNEEAAAGRNIATNEARHTIFSVEVDEVWLILSLKRRQPINMLLAIR
jgi:hypothetical protein